MNANIFEKTNQIIRSCEDACFGVIDENGFPSVSTVSIVKPETMLTLYFTTNVGGNKEKRLAKNNRASICFRKDYNNITLVGKAEIITDQKIKDHCWLDWFIDHYPGGATDPDYIVIKFTTQRVSLYVDQEIAAFTIDAFMKVQSRCGLLCDGCTYRETHHCSGCLALNGKPFWGECPVALCCQNKGYAHCGECPEMPCDILKEFSCGGGEHGDKPAGARIAVCKAWA